MPEHKTPDPSAQNPPGESISQPPKTPQQTDQTNHPNEQKVKKNDSTPPTPESDSHSNTSNRNNHKLASSSSGNKKKKNYTKREKSKARRERAITIKHNIKYTPPQKAEKPKNNKKIKLITILAVLLGSPLIIIALDCIASNISQIAKVMEEWKLVSIPLSLALFSAFILFAGPKIFTGLQQIIMKLTNKYFISSLTCFALVGALSALLIPSHTNWFRNPESSTTQQATTTENKNKPQESSNPTNSSNNNKVAEVEQKTTSDIRLHILYLTGGIIAILSLIETNRKNTLEHSRQTHAARRDRYIEAVDKLSSEHAPVRLGGVYTLIALFEEWLTDETLTKNIRERECQVIINNLCAYIRSPFPLAAKAETFTEIKMSQHSTPSKINRYIIANKSFSNNRIKFIEEKEIRQTIFKELSLRIADENNGPKKEFEPFIFNFEGSPIFYSLRGLNFLNANFSGATFYGKANFIDANFFSTLEYETNFSDSTFTGFADFSIATFWGRTKFNRATFEKDAEFNSCHFEKKRHSGDDAPFSQVTTIPLGISDIRLPNSTDLFVLPLNSIPFYRHLDGSYIEAKTGRPSEIKENYWQNLEMERAFKAALEKSQSN
jgi:hypothetical protein